MYKLTSQHYGAVCVMCYEVVEGVEHERRVRVNAAEPDASMCTADRRRYARGGPRARPRRTGRGGALCRAHSSVSSSARVPLLVQRPHRRPSVVAPSVVVVWRWCGGRRTGSSEYQTNLPRAVVRQHVFTFTNDEFTRRAPGPVRSDRVLLSEGSVQPSRIGRHMNKKTHAEQGFILLSPTIFHVLRREGEVYSPRHLGWAHRPSARLRALGRRKGDCG